MNDRYQLQHRFRRRDTSDGRLGAAVGNDFVSGIDHSKPASSRFSLGKVALDRKDPGDKQQHYKALRKPRIVEAGLNYLLLRASLAFRFIIYGVANGSLKRRLKFAVALALLVAPIYLLSQSSEVKTATPSCGGEGVGGSASTVFLTSGTSWDVPSDWNDSNNSIEVIGGGGAAGNPSGIASGGGGGGGAYSGSTNVDMPEGSTVTIQVGSGGTSENDGGDTYICDGTSNCASLAGTAVVVGAEGGGGGSSATGGTGGDSVNGVGSTKYSGGDGGSTSGSNGGGGGGGSAGPSGAGQDGGGSSFFGGAGGGGSNGGSSTSGGAAAGGESGADGGHGTGGTGGGAGGVSGGANNGEADDGTDGGGGGGGGDNGSDSVGGAGGDGGMDMAFDSTHGAGGGGGGDSSGPGGDGGDGGGYGGGGGGEGGNGGTPGTPGSGAQGIIVITYTPEESGGNHPCLSLDGYIFENDDGSTSIENTQLAGSEFSSGTTLGGVRAGQRTALRMHFNNGGAAAIDSDDEIGLFYDRGDGYWTQVDYASPPISGVGSGCDSNLWTCDDLATTSDVGEYSSIAIDPASGRPWISYYDNGTNDDLVLAQYVGRDGSGCDSGATDWTCTTIDDTDTVGLYSSIAIDSNGKAWISYHDDTNGDLMIAEYVGTGGSGCASGVTDWDCDILDDSVTDTGEYTSITIDADGSPWVSYYASTGSDLLVAEYVGGGSGSGCASGMTDWSCGAIDSSVDGGQYTSIAVDGNGAPWISYYDIGNSALKVAKYIGGSSGSCDDTAWDCETVDADNTVGTWTSIAISPTNVPWISYSNDSTSDLKVAEYVTSGGNCDDTNGSDAWQCTGVATTPAAGEYTSIAFAPDGNPWVSYHHDTSDDLYIARYIGSGGSGCDSSAWNCDAIQTNNDTGTYTSLAFAPDGNAWLSYQYATSSDLRIAHVNRGGELVISPSFGHSNGAVIDESHVDMTSATDTTGRDDADCLPAGTTWNDGAWFEAPIATGLSVPAGDTTTQCTEVAWVLNTYQAEPGTTYRLIIATKDNWSPSRGVWRGPAVLSAYAELDVLPAEEITYSYSKATLGAFNADCDDTDWECSTVTSTATQTGADLSMAFRPDGSALIAQYDSTAGQRGVELVEYVGTGGSGCADSAWNCSTIETTGDVGENLSIAVASDGDPWISYAGSSGLSVARYVGSGGSCDDTAWECTDIDTTTGASTDSVVRIGPSGEVYIAYIDANSDQLWLAQYVGGSGGTGCSSSAWTCTQIDDVSPTSEGEGVGIAIDNDGTPWLAYISADTENDVLVARYVGTGGSNCATDAWDCTTVYDSGVNAGASITIDGSGDPWVAFSRSSSNGVYVAQFVGGSSGSGCATGADDWTCTGVVTGNDHLNPSIATDSSGNPWLSFSDDSGDDMYVARYVSSGGSGCTSSAWTCETVDSSSTQEVESSLAFDSSGNPWIAYTTGSGSDFEVSIAHLELPPNNLSSSATVPYNGGISAGDGSLSYSLDIGLSPATDEFGDCNGSVDHTGYCGLFHPEGYLDSLAAQTDERAIYGFATSFDTNSELPTGSLYYQTDLAPSSSSVVLQVYRHGSTNAWETITTDSSSSDCSTNCVLSGAPSGTVSEYFELIDGRYWLNYRVYQTESSSSSFTFSPDGFKVYQTALQLRHGRVFRDEMTDPLQ